ncbi:MAG: carboxypeptidase-like regulatory domain-containing protein [Bacteroidales bacterium]|nr:carboxypeptidase-like regulatory domain-containing protein [Bacteroidales bacterium]
MKRLIVIALLLACSVAAVAQSDDKAKHGRINYYGIVVATDSLRPIRNTHVISKMAHCGTVTNLDGRFVIPAKSIDTLWVSCLGYSRQLIPIDSTMAADRDTLFIKLRSDTITLREVTVFPFYNYETFKEMLITMPSIEVPREIQKTYEDLEDLWMSRTPAGNGMLTVTANPIQFLYDKYNKSARRQSMLLRNRRIYNEMLREQGRTDELLPDTTSLPMNFKVYELDEMAESGENNLGKSRKTYRRMYNDIMREQGRYNELLPDSLDYPVEYKVFEPDEASKVGKAKPLVPKKKYIRFGN